MRDVLMGKPISSAEMRIPAQLRNSSAKISDKRTPIKIRDVLLGQYFGHLPVEPLGDNLSAGCKIHDIESFHRGKIQHDVYVENFFVPEEALLSPQCDLLPGIQRWVETHKKYRNAVQSRTVVAVLQLLVKT